MTKYKLNINQANIKCNVLLNSFCDYRQQFIWY